MTIPSNPLLFAPLSEVLSAVKTALEIGDLRAIVRATSGRNEVTMLWSAAMTAHWGPTGIHPSRCDGEWRPTAETLVDCPRVKEAMDEALASLPGLLASAERHGFC
jgi:hypothetical protein